MIINRYPVLFPFLWMEYNGFVKSFIKDSEKEEIDNFGHG